MRARTVIVGGGIMGAAVALKLARRADPLREPVVLLERRDLAAGSSGRSGAILRQHYADARVALMARDSLREYAAFEGLTARPIGFRRSGVLSIAGPEVPDWIERIERNHEVLRGAGIDVRRVGPAEIAALVPGIKVAPGSVGLWEPDGGFVDPRRTVEAFAALARTYGAVTRLGVEARELLIEDGRAVGVRAGDETFEAESVVVCAGPWTGRLMEANGYALPLSVVRPENTFLRLPTSYAETDADGGRQGRGVNLDDPLEALSEQLAGQGIEDDADRIHPVILDLERGYYARCESSEHRTRIGSTSYDDARELDDPDDLDEHVPEASRAWARAAIAARIPVYAREPDCGAIAGWYTLSPDAMPLVGALPEVRGLYLAAGFSGHGFKLAPSIAEGLTQEIHGEPVTAYPTDLFAPGRFAIGATRSSPFGF